MLGFYEMITNRSFEDTKVGKEWQYTIIQNMVQTLSTFPQLDNQNQKRNDLVRYLKGGTFPLIIYHMVSTQFAFRSIFLTSTIYNGSCNS